MQLLYPHLRRLLLVPLPPRLQESRVALRQLRHRLLPLPWMRRLSR